MSFLTELQRNYSCTGTQISEWTPVNAVCIQRVWRWQAVTAGLTQPGIVHLVHVVSQAPRALGQLTWKPAWHVRKLGELWEGHPKKGTAGQVCGASAWCPLRCWQSDKAFLLPGQMVSFSALCFRHPWRFEDTSSASQMNWCKLALGANRDADVCLDGLGKHLQLAALKKTAVLPPFPRNPQYDCSRSGSCTPNGLWGAPCAARSAPCSKVQGPHNVRKLSSWFTSSDGVFTCSTSERF